MKIAFSWKIYTGEVKSGYIASVMFQVRASKWEIQAESIYFLRHFSKDSGRFSFHIWTKYMSSLQIILLIGKKNFHMTFILYAFDICVYTSFILLVLFLLVVDHPHLSTYA